MVTLGLLLVHLTVQGSPGVPMWFTSLCGGHLGFLCGSPHCTGVRGHQGFPCGSPHCVGGSPEVLMRFTSLWRGSTGFSMWFISLCGDPPAVSMWFISLFGGLLVVAMWFTSLCRGHPGFHGVLLTVRGHVGFPCGSPHCAVVTWGFHVVHLTVWGSQGVSMGFTSLCRGHLGFPCSSPHCEGGSLGVFMWSTSLCRGVTRGFHVVHLTVWRVT